MKRDSVNYFYVGLFVLAAAVVLLITLFRVTTGGGKTDTYYTSYRNVAGVNQGTPVTYEGYAFGKVAGIEPRQGKDGTLYQVELRVKHGWKIPADSTASIYSEGLLADTVINISEGNSDHYLDPGSDIEGTRGIDLFAVMGQVAGDFSELSNNAIRPLLESLNRTVTTVGGELEAYLPVILRDLQLLVARLDDSASHLSGILNDDTEMQARRILDNVEQAATGLNEVSHGLVAIKDDAAELVHELDSLVIESRPDLQQSIADLRYLLEQVSRYSEGILQNMDSTSRNMNEFSRQIRENPGRLFGGSAPVDKGARRD